VPTYVFDLHNARRKIRKGERDTIGKKRERQGKMDITRKLNRKVVRSGRGKEGAIEEKKRMLLFPGQNAHD
jgi:hypothetical protein